MKRCYWILGLVFGAALSSLGQTYPLKVCSFNIQFLGQSKVRDDAGLAQLLKDYDVVVVQELVAPPYPGTFPDGTPFHPDLEAQRFFGQMTNRGYNYWLSEEDTGPGKKNHLNTSATEWFVAFYKGQAVAPARDLPSGFLSPTRARNPDYDRVPYAFSFRTVDAKMDFVLISVHLHPNAGLLNMKRRKHELAAVGAWVGAHSQKEKDFIILGDMNIEGVVELASDTPSGYRSLNEECKPTNTNVKSRKPYDHVMYEPAFTEGEIDHAFGFQVVNLVDSMRPAWKAISKKRYPGGPPYDHNKFRKYYSDHDPVEFRLVPLPGGDDD